MVTLKVKYQIISKTNIFLKRGNLWESFNRAQEPEDPGWINTRII